VAFVTDLPPFPNSPPNVRYFPLSLNALKKRIHTIFAVNANHIVPYKLCDLRPAFGVIFPDVIQRAEFWGHGDNDMVLGRLHSFITPQRLSRHDVLSFKQGHLQGPFTIYRNIPRVNDLFRDGGHFHHVLSRPEYLHFDEFGPNVFYKRISSIEEVRALPSDNISVIAFKRALAGDLSVYCEQHGKESLTHRDKLVYEDGRVLDSRSGREYMFYHWVLEKRAVWFRYPSWAASRPHRFYMSTTGFYSVTENRAFCFLHAWRITRGALKWAGLKGANYIKRRLGLRVKVDTYPRLGWVKRLESSD
jgi:hypothetical protein